MKLIKIGKVKDIYETNANTLIFSFSDRISAFDVIFEDKIPYKGKVLCDFAVYWFEKLKHKNHFIERVSPTMIEVKKLQMVPIECVVRAYLYGSLYYRYLNNNLKLNELDKYFEKTDLQLASKLPQLLFDPTTKSDEHDEFITESWIIKNQLVTTTEFNFIKNSSIDLFRIVDSVVSAADFILCDIKFEFGRDENTGELFLADSIGPDEFRLWNKNEYRPGVIQESYDKQLLRDWLEKIGFKREVEECNKLNIKPKIPRLPSNLLTKISDRYISAYERITGLAFEKT